MKTVFIVDDNDTNLMAAKLALSGIYKTFALPSSERMFQLLERLTPDLILLDVDMPEMDGYQTIQTLKSSSKHKSIPVIFLTAKQDAESEIRGFELGALDYINKPFSPPVLVRRIETHIETDKLIKQGQAKIFELHNATITVISDMVEKRDTVTGGHIERTQMYLEILIDALIRGEVYTEEIHAWDLNLLLPSAQLHDVGKITISDTILNKPGKLSDEEFELIKTHTTEGERIIDLITERTQDEGFLRHARLFAGCHHEKWNGKGYPRGLQGTDIPLEGRIMAVVDVYDALVCDRPYKKPFSHEEAVEIITKDSGTHFDPSIISVFTEVADAFREKFLEMAL